MTGTTPKAGDTVNPLLAPLTETQLALLDAVWHPVSMAIWEPLDWPNWDYVSRSLYQVQPSVDDAVAVLESLPTVRPGHVNSGRPYGLVWHNGNVAFSPDPDSKVGLTIAGMAQLASSRVGISGDADFLAGLIRSLADAESRLQPHPYSVSKADFSLSDLTEPLQRRSAGRLYYLTEAMIASVLQHEYAPIQVIGPQDGPFTVPVGRPSLREYRGITNADGYLALIGRKVEALAEPEAWTSPLTLVQTLDYLSYVLAADSEWREKRRLVEAPDLQSATAFTANVATRPEYETALSGVWNVLAQMAVPSVPIEIAEKQFEGKQPASIYRLEYWLSQRLREDAAAFHRTRESLGVVRAVGRIRSESQHGSARARDEAVKARAKLGLPEVIFDYHEAWSHICARLAGAFDVIRQEVQTAPPAASAADPGD